jgi:hypothetical protein
MVLYVPRRSISITVLNPFEERPSIGDKLFVSDEGAEVRTSCQLLRRLHDRYVQTLR